jgi:hypothetical protein
MAVPPAEIFYPLRAWLILTSIPVLRNFHVIPTSRSISGKQNIASQLWLGSKRSNRRHIKNKKANPWGDVPRKANSYSHPVVTFLYRYIKIIYRVNTVLGFIRRTWIVKFQAYKFSKGPFLRSKPYPSR